MTSSGPHDRENAVPPTADETSPAAFSSNAVRLSLREWGVVFLLVLLVMTALPRLWRRYEPFAPEPDYRVPYALSEDYWVYARLAASTMSPPRVAVIGDSVIWGEYVRPGETLSHYLNDRLHGVCFANAGLNGTHPLALAGLLESAASPLRGRPVLLHCNLLWMSSPERDLQTPQELHFNHPRLVPQFRPWIPSYRAGIDERMGHVLDRHVGLREWSHHLRVAFFENQDVPSWSLEHPYACPLGRVRRQMPAPADAPHSPAQVWTERGMARQDIPWIALGDSLQWQAFRDAVRRLQSRNNRVFVLVGPFNEHLLAEPSRRRYKALQQQVAEWLQEARVPHYLPPPLPSNEYADASHPLAPGYARLARWMYAEQAFVDWTE